MPLILKTISVPKPYGHGEYLLYFARIKADTKLLEIDPDMTKIWHQLTGRKTITPKDCGLIADLTQGQVKIQAL